MVIVLVVSCLHVKFLSLAGWLDGWLADWLAGWLASYS